MAFFYLFTGDELYFFEPNTSGLTTKYSQVKTQGNR